MPYDRTEYNTCMGPWIKGQKDIKDDRRMSFCVGAKICSGKAKTLEEGKKLCAAGFARKLGIQSEEMRLTIDDLTVKIDGKEVVISPELITKLCGCKRK
jgi:hypothetical protein